MRMTRPLKFIGEDIRNLETADWMRRCGNLIQESLMRSGTRFNEMTGQIENLIREVYENNFLLTQAQVKYLQSRINPHFMFNILSMLSMEKQDCRETKNCKSFERIFQTDSGKDFPERRD